MSTQETGAKRKRDLLIAAGHLLAEKPCLTITYQEIAEKAGISRGGAQKLYPTRERLFMAAYAATFPRWPRDFAQAVVAEQDELLPTLITHTLNQESILLALTPLVDTVLLPAVSPSVASHFHHLRQQQLTQASQQIDAVFLKSTAGTGARLCEETLGELSLIYRRQHLQPALQQVDRRFYEGENKRLLAALTARVQAIRGRRR